MDRTGTVTGSGYRAIGPYAQRPVESLGGRWEAVRDWWDRWEPVLAVAIPVLMVLGIGLLWAGVVPLDDTRSGETGTTSSRGGTRTPSSRPPGGRVDVRATGALAAQPGGPAVGAPAEDR